MRPVRAAFSQIGVRLDDGGRLAAEFERRFRDIRLAVVQHLAARVDAARQRDHADLRMRADGFGGGVIHRQDVDHAHGQPARSTARASAKADSGVVARPHDHGVTRDQRRRDLAHQRADQGD